MLPGQNRMRRSADFRAAVRGGRRAGTATLVVHVAAGAAGESHARPARVGFVVSRSVGSAVERNRVRRRLREAVRTRVGGLPAGSLVVVRAQAAAATADWEGLRRDVDRALARALSRGAGSGVTNAVDACRPPRCGTGAG